MTIDFISEMVLKMLLSNFAQTALSGGHMGFQATGFFSNTSIKSHKSFRNKEQYKLTKPFAHTKNYI